MSIDFAYDLPDDAFTAEMEGSAAFLAEVPGLVWKVWSMDPATKRANGTYLFRNADAAEFYVKRIFSAGPPTKPHYADFDIRQLDVLETASRTTRASLD